MTDYRKEDLDTIDKEQAVSMFRKGMLEARKGNIKLSTDLFNELEARSLPNDRFVIGLIALGRANIHFRCSKINEGEKYGKLALQSFDPEKECEFYIEAKNIVANLVMERGNYEEAAKIHKENIQYSIDKKLRKEYAIACNNYAYCLILQGKDDKAEEILSDAFSTAIAVSSVLHLSFLRNMAIIARRRGEYRKAKELLYTTQEIAMKNQNNLFLNIAHHDLAIIATEQGDYEIAQKYFYESKNDLESRNLINKRMILLFADLGSLFHKTNQVDKSLLYFREALSLYKQLNIEDSIVENMCKYSEALISSGELEIAESILDQATSYTDAHNNETDSAQVCFRLGLVQLHKKRYNLAKQFFRRTLDYLKSANLGSIQIRTLSSLATTILLSNGDTSEVMGFVDQAYQAAKVQNAFPLLVEVMQVKALIKSVQKLYDEAESILKEALSIAKEKEFTLDIMRIEKKLKYNESQRILNSEYTLEEKDLSKDEIYKLFIRENLLHEFQRLVYNQEIAVKQKLDSDQFILFFVRQTTGGPEISMGANIHIDDMYRNVAYLQAASLFTAIVGSGHSYHLGVFGPFPFDNRNVALVYSAIIADKNYPDSRSPGRNYILACLVYPNDHRHRNYDILEMEKLFNEHFGKYNDLSQVNEQDLEKLRMKLVQMFENKAL
ncbi:MAG: tetratricopeptide repeat protein [Candidatus Odinarchaeota archaeon]